MLMIPLDFDTSWILEKYNGIPSHSLSYNAQEGGLMKVRSSASPLVYPFPNGLDVHGFEVHGKISGSIKLALNEIQGSKNADDFHFRFGLVKAGNQRLNFATKLIAPEWVKTLYSLAPKNAGIEKVEFYNLAYDENIPWKKRDHPLSELLEENIADVIQEEGEFKIKMVFPRPIKIWALWLSSDGDDTGSNFDIQIKKILLHQSASNR